VRAFGVGLIMVPSLLECRTLSNGPSWPNLRLGTSMLALPHQAVGWPVRRTGLTLTRTSTRAPGRFKVESSLNILVLSLRDECNCPASVAEFQQRLALPRRALPSGMRAIVLLALLNSGGYQCFFDWLYSDFCDAAGVHLYHCEAAAFVDYALAFFGDVAQAQ